MEIAKAEIKYAIPCGVCGTSVELNELEVNHTTFRLCPKCIEAIKWAKEQIAKGHCYCKSVIGNKEE